MPVVKVLGVANPIQFPDDMDITDIKQVLRQKFASQMLEPPTIEAIGDTAAPAEQS